MFKQGVPFILSYMQVSSFMSEKIERNNKTQEVIFLPKWLHEVPEKMASQQGKISFLDSRLDSTSKTEIKKLIHFGWKKKKKKKNTQRPKLKFFKRAILFIIIAALCTTGNEEV